MPDGSPARYASLNFANKAVLNAFLTSSGMLKLTVDMETFVVKNFNNIVMRQS